MSLQSGLLGEALSAFFTLECLKMPENVGSVLETVSE